MNYFQPYLYNLMFIIVFMFFGWIYSLYRRNVTIVDSLWGLGFIVISWLTWFQTDGYWARQLLISALVTLWGIRLAVYLTIRNHGKGEDPRYAKWREAIGEGFWLISLFKVFLLQAVFLWLISLVIQVGQSSKSSLSIGVLDTLGVFIWTVGFLFESIGDWQLARFKADPDNQGEVMDKGLWRFTRHPNYFGECLIWWGLFLIALSDPDNWWTILSPLIITLVLLKITGIPLTEKLIVEKRPGYREYVRKTSAFFPWFPENKNTERGSS